MENKILPVFTPEDFLVNGWSQERAEVCATIASAKIAKLLGPVVAGPDHPDSCAKTNWVQWPGASDALKNGCRFFARLFDVQPIGRAEQDTAESLLRELVNDPQSVATGLSPTFYNRAKKLLGRADE